MEKIVVLYLLLINVVTFATYSADKWKAQHYRTRIPEATLLLLAAIGGSVGALLAIWLFRHKTKHPRFTWGVPGILLIQFALLWFCSCTRLQAAPPPKPAEHSPSTLIVTCDSATGKPPTLER